MIPAMLPQGVLDQLGLGQQPPQSGVLLAQRLEFLGGVGVHPAIRAAPVYRVASETPSSAAISSGLYPPQLVHPHGPPTVVLPCSGRCTDSSDS